MKNTTTTTKWKKIIIQKELKGMKLLLFYVNFMP